MEHLHSVVLTFTCDLNISSADGTFVKGKVQTRSSAALVAL